MQSQFTIYYSNQLEVQKAILLRVMDITPLNNPFESEVILVQSPGMAKWLQWKIAEEKGIASNIKFPMPATFIWQQYVDNLSNVEKISQFNKESIIWRLMRLIPTFLDKENFQPLRHYLKYSQEAEQQKLYQLACKIADLFDQYLVYRPEWIDAWENNQDDKIEQAIIQFNKLKANQSINNEKNDRTFTQVSEHIQWQGLLWRALVREIKQENPNAHHRANLHKRFLELLAIQNPQHLPKRIFVFGISALPKVYLDTLQALSDYCQVHLFFNSASKEYWGDIIDERYLQKLQQKKRYTYLSDSQGKFSSETRDIFSENQLVNIGNEKVDRTNEGEKLQIGHPLLASWGKLGRDFLYLLSDIDHLEIEAYTEGSDRHLLAQLQTSILNLATSKINSLIKKDNDRSISFHSCYSIMREVEALQDYLLHLFNENKNKAEDEKITPKDIVVMVADIDKYTPYIQAVFSQGEHYIPFSISDNKLSESDVLVMSFIHLLNLKESLFTAEEVLAFLDIPSIREHFDIEENDLVQIRYWVEKSGIRFGLEKSLDNQQKNYNSWKAGLERMLLGYAMREENGIWQDSLGFDSSYGLQGEIAGSLSAFIDCLYQWQQILQGKYQAEQWQAYLSDLIDGFFAETPQSSKTLWYFKENIQALTEQLQSVQFTDVLSVEVIAETLTEKLQEIPNSLTFLAGKVNFCTLLPMRSIPFKVVCLLGMNDGEYPRQQTANSFDLMFYHRQKGDRVRRDDDRYLFLEALLSAQDYLYISYIGRSIVDDSEREPSVLVSQLLDYLAENLSKIGELSERKQIKNSLIKQHSMTAFGEQNFKGNDRTFAKRWLSVAKADRQQADNHFIQPLQCSEQIEVIELENLIAFICDPVKFFFERRLGVYLGNDIDTIADTENFILDSLDNYLINEQLIHCDSTNFNQFFEQLKIKGTMPRGTFAEIYQQNFEDNILDFKEQINTYLTEQYDSIYIDQLIEVDNRKIRLRGTLDHLYNNNTQRVTWRVASIKNKDIIQVWIPYLLQIVTQKRVLPAIHYGRDGYKTFSSIEKTTALKQLEVYIKDYLLGQNELFLVPSAFALDYLKNLLEKDGTKKEQSTVDLDKCFSEVTKIIAGDCYSKGNIYWQRVFEQTDLVQEQLESINQKTVDWFEVMNKSLVK
ncbi:exodeoxyribonuclease V subunit gamma [Bisgaardia hudsonensis]|nr:exodeoxyribonuclease V subunit gamma [Bisgaardia hudsonensis]QLB13886.1 exodeoxyribonuclease V subunit gamma [Bisgaardia hudsonensis]